MAKRHLSISPVARAVPLDNTTASFRATEVQTALEETRHRIVWDVTSQATTLNGSLVLLEASDSLQILTGTATGFSVTLPDATTLFNGRKFEIINNTTQPVTIKDGSGATLLVLAQTSIAYITLQSNSSVAGAWVHWQIFISIAGGILNYSLSSSVAFATSSTTDVAITSFTLTPQAGTYAVYYNASVFHTTTPRSHWWSLFRAGIKITDSERRQETSHSNTTMVDSTLAIVSFDGSQSLGVRVRVENGSLTVNDRTILLIRLGN